MSVGESWGRYPRAEQLVVTPDRRDVDWNLHIGSYLPYGNGRSYGDSCLNDGGTLLHTRRLDHYIAFDPMSGVICCEAGVQLSDVLSLVVPTGWFLPVVPGTKFVTVGGAIANDIHGKNHPIAGTFGHHVRALELLRSNGQRIVCSADQNPDWFRATVGGLGLTGLITWAEISLSRIAGPWLAAEILRFDHLREFFSLSEDFDKDQYKVAWIDCLARGKSLGRGLFTRGNHASEQPVNARPFRLRRSGVPFTPPLSLVNPVSVYVFNAVYWRRQLRRRRAALMHYEPFFFPLDGLANWNRMYGRDGFLQYQCVVPHAVAIDAIEELLRAIASSGVGSFLTVLKQFGSRAPVGLVSFPREGTTFAIDFPIDRYGKAFRLLDRLDDIVAAAGGAVYPAKDARMSSAHFPRFFPGWEELRSFVDPRFSSSFWRRVTGTET